MDSLSVDRVGGVEDCDLPVSVTPITWDRIRALDLLSKHMLLTMATSDGKQTCVYIAMIKIGRTQLNKKRCLCSVRKPSCAHGALPCGGAVFGVVLFHVPCWAVRMYGLPSGVVCLGTWFSRRSGTHAWLVLGSSGVVVHTIPLLNSAVPIPVSHSFPRPLVWRSPPILPTLHAEP